MGVVRDPHWLSLAAAVAVSAVGACARQVRAPAFEDRVALFTTYAASLPPCGAGRPQTVEQLLGGTMQPGERTTVAGHLAPACTDERLEEPLLNRTRKGRPSVPGCPPQRAVWVLWGSRTPRPSPATSDQPACVHVDPDTLADGIVLAPRPTMLGRCDFEAAEQAIPGLAVSITGKLAVLSQDRPAGGVELHVEGICRM